jgi:uncharacterized protein (TIGR02145 family)
MEKNRVLRNSSILILGILCFVLNGCKKDDDNDFVRDIDSNEYGTVTIGDQVWMKANLRTTRYNDGIEIPNVTDNTEWGNLTTGAYCWFFNDITYKTPHGALYNWYAVNTEKLCPEGWRVASDQDWFELTFYLGGELVAGGKLKTPGSGYWLAPNTDATNETGFTAIPGGRRYVGEEYPEFIGHFSIIEIEKYAAWWSSTEYSTTEAYHRLLTNESSYIQSKYYNKGEGLSVRCIKN